MTMMVPLLLTLIGADFPISTAAGYTGYASVICAQDQYYVFWEDQRQRPLTSVYAARVTRQGTVLDPEGRELWTDSVGYRVSAAWDGENFLVVTRNHC
jgi:hypothetical protein